MAVETWRFGRLDCLSNRLARMVEPLICRTVYAGRTELSLEDCQRHQV